MSYSTGGGSSGSLSGPFSGFPGTVKTVSNLVDLREKRGIDEAFAAGVGKAHRQIVYDHTDHRSTAASRGMMSRKALVR